VFAEPRGRVRVSIGVLGEEGRRARSSMKLPVARFAGVRGRERWRVMS